MLELRFPFTALCFGANYSSPPCARTPPKPKSPATSCCCAPATSASSPRASTATCFWRSARCSRSSSIVREEMDAIGGQEMLLPALHPAEVWQESGRWDIMGDNMFRLKDRFGRDLCLGMTHEEVMTVDRARRAAQLQATAADLVSDPDQVPRRAAAEVGPAARAPVHHEGLVHLRHGRGRPGRGVREALRGLLPHLRPLRPGVHRGGSALGRDGRQPVARVHGGVGRRRGFRGDLPKLRLRGESGEGGVARRSRRRRIPEGDLAPEEFHTPGRKTIAEVAAVHRPARDLADEEPGDGGRRQAGAGAAARRSSVERDQVRRRGGRSGVPAGASRRDSRMVRRRGRFARTGGREEHADPGRPGAARAGAT